jgi:hypothetical protein
MRTMITFTRVRTRATQDAGYSLVEFLVSMGILTVIIGATLGGLADVIRGNEAVLSMTTMNNSVRIAMDMVVRDMLSVGSGLPPGHVIQVPSQMPAIASGTVLTTHATASQGTSLIGGFIKIEKQNSAGVWSDVTTEILNLGFGDRNQQGYPCSDPTPDAVIRIQRLRDNGLPTTATTCGYNNSRNPVDWWPNVLYDAREGSYRDAPTTDAMKYSGVMNYVSIDVGNVKRWFAGTIGTTGSEAWNQNGYIAYFSDRRGDHDENNADRETSEFGAEDIVNPAHAAFTPSGAMEAGEDFNENGTFETYGHTPHALALPAGSIWPLDSTARPWSTINDATARVTRQVLFRRALKVVNACIGTATANPSCNAANGVNNLPDSGLTIASENPVYVHGSYNATTVSTATPERPAAILGDAVTLLSKDFKDIVTLQNPNTATNRNATQTGFRMALVSGKTPAFPRPAWATGIFIGLDGGAHNFVRLLEDWSAAPIYYRGSMVSLYHSRQATGMFRFNSSIYTQGTREFAFDTNFMDPAKLPPGTPMFRDVNTLKFRQILRPNQ